MREFDIHIQDEWGEHRLHTLEFGSKSAGRVVVCVHGLTRNAHDFDSLAQSLGQQGYRVFSVDMPGRGGSSWLDDPKGYAVPVYAAQMCAWLDAMGFEQVDWIGTSMGGLIALEMARANRFRSLVLNDIGPFVPQSALAMIKSYLELDLSFANLAELEAHLRQIHAPFGALSDAQWAHLARHSARSEGGRLRLHYDPLIKVNFAESAAEDIGMWDAWPAIDCSALIIRGAASALLSSRTVDEMLKRNPNAQALKIADTGHAPALMDDDQIKAISDFLAKA